MSSLILVSACALAVGCGGIFLVVTSAFTSAAALDRGYPAEDENPFKPPGGNWPILSKEELAGAAALYPMTAAPPVLPQPFVPLLSRLRRLRAGIHHKGDNAPVRGHSIPRSRHQARRIPVGQSQTFASKAFYDFPSIPVSPDEPTLPPPLYILPLGAPDLSSSHVFQHRFQFEQSTSISPLRAIVFFLFAAVALGGLAAQMWHLAEKTLSPAPLSGKVGSPFPIIPKEAGEVLRATSKVR
mmetsp:Transcript_8402/g.13425  ORF Transcript_8402/g.13425 Transcript_8402/m.13425 type:complete len:241 (+) Transcript_8402:80-802(+)